MPTPPLRPLLRPAGELVPDVRRIAVVRVSGIGDLVFALPALEALRAAYPHAEISYLAGDWHVPFLTGRPGPWDRVLLVPPYPGVGAGPDVDRDSPAVRAFFAEQRGRGYEVAVQLHGGGANSNPFVERLGARVTAGLRAAGAPPLQRWLPYLLYQNEVVRFLEVVGLVGAVPVMLQPTIAVTEADRTEAAAVLPPAGRPLVVIHSGAGDPRRRWPADRFAAVGRALAGRAATVVTIGGTADRATTAAVAASVGPGAVDLGGRLTLRGTLGLLARAALFIGDDSGPRHLAEAVGTPTVAVFWCGNVITAAPLTRARHRVAISFRTTCPACGADQSADRCPHDPSFVAEVPVAEVLDHALDLYDPQAVDSL